MDGVEDAENICPSDIDRFTVKELKNFLRNHNQTVTGRSASLKERAKGVLSLRLPHKVTLKGLDEEDLLFRECSKYRTPLGEQLPNPQTLTDGWTDDVSQIPAVTEKDLYNYLVSNSNRTFDDDIAGAVKQTKAKVFYEDNHVFSVQYHDLKKSSHGYVNCRVIPSIPSASEAKQPNYVTWISLSKITGQVHAADCSCVAGNGETCNHVAALLWCLVDITSKKADGTLLSTSQKCKWNQPRKRKLSPSRAEDVVFRKVKKKSTTGVSKLRQYNPASHDKSVIDKDLFREKLGEILPHAGFHKLFKKLSINDSLKAKCCMPEPLVNFMKNVDLLINTFSFMKNLYSLILVKLNF